MSHVLIFQHDPDTECCALAETPKGIRAGVRGRLSDFIQRSEIILPMKIL
ncbi:MAG: hypothetical protein MZV63_43840 [Marinilabiliales bacterium]|nr:hypothetical protein [Marinilabiliales bacterium]